jgi:DNA-binding response OmpR family regulator
MEITEKNELDDFSQLTVLIIDDNRLVHDTLKRGLYDIGINHVKCAENAYYGIRLCETERFNIIICSFNVNSDKDGFHLLEELKFRGHVNKTTVLIFLSTETSESLVNSIVELQPDDFWVKPLAPKNVKERLIHTLQTKKQLFNMYRASDTKSFSKVIYFADRHLANKRLHHFHSNISRMKGEAYLSLLEFETAEGFYKGLMKTYTYAWVYLGYVKSLLKQGRIKEIYDLLEKLMQKPATRFGAHDMLAQYYIEQAQFDKAYDEIKKATELSPRNIERNKKSWDLARLNHDHEGQYIATRNIVRQAKNSIHDSPELLLNVIRSGIDLAGALTDGRTSIVLKQTDKDIKQLESEYSNDISEFKQQLLVIKARLYIVREHKGKATKLILNHVDLKASPQIEDNLDKVKVFHELGMREEALKMLDVISNQVSGDSLTSQVINKYIEQESIERVEINFSPKQLNDMSIEHFEKNRLKPALDTIQQALRLTPHNIKLTMRLLKILIALKESNEFEECHDIFGKEAIEVLLSSNVKGSGLEAIEKLKIKWQEAEPIKRL